MACVTDDISPLKDRMTRWRRRIHKHPETAFEERKTAAFVAAKLREFGLAVEEGIAQTGVVGTLKTGNGPAIGLRADMDALDIHELNEFDHRSQVAGKMHACGHDGHTTMLLGAAAALSGRREFSGTVHFIFQPAEENEGGGGVMVREGLFERFPVDAVYGMHNWPGLEVGKFAIRPGPIMAAFDTFECVIQGTAAHAAMPHLGTDTIVAAGKFVEALQTIVSRNLDPLDSGVISITQIHGGDTWNALPDHVTIRGCTRHFSVVVQDMIERRIEDIARGIGLTCGVEIRVTYERRYPATVNSHPETRWAVSAAQAVVGTENVLVDIPPCMGSEDFGFMLQEKPGSYIYLGNGPVAGGCLLHNPHYDFNDDALIVGTRYWVQLVKERLPLK